MNHEAIHIVRWLASTLDLDVMNHILSSGRVGLSAVYSLMSMLTLRSDIIDCALYSSICIDSPITIISGTPGAMWASKTMDISPGGFSLLLKVMSHNPRLLSILIFVTGSVQPVSVELRCRIR